MASFFEDLMEDLAAEPAAQVAEVPAAAAAAAAQPIVDWRIMCDADLRIRARKKLYALLWRPER